MRMVWSWRCASYSSSPCWGGGGGGWWCDGARGSPSSGAAPRPAPGHATSRHPTLRPSSPPPLPPDWGAGIGDSALSLSTRAALVAELLSLPADVGGRLRLAAGVVFPPPKNAVMGLEPYVERLAVSGDAGSRGVSLRVAPRAAPLAPCGGSPRHPSTTWHGCGARAHHAAPRGMGGRAVGQGRVRPS